MWANGAPLPSLTNQRLSLDRETPRSDLSLFGMASNEANLTDLIATVHPACVGDRSLSSERRPTIACHVKHRCWPSLFRAAQTR
ncbi:hypothetical protein V2G26_000526 [Clonostachys chloroleuca]